MPDNPSSQSFGLLAQRSEQDRVRLFLSVLILLGLLAMLRRLAGDVVMTSQVY
ncbi:MAG: hypothetical protein K8S99_03695 [Planctomycetes bacterium]|nr:hypothetical protein [Planctomycetota bacterium]